MVQEFDKLENKYRSLNDETAEVSSVRQEIKDGILSVLLRMPLFRRSLDPCSRLTNIFLEGKTISEHL